jgi:pyruvate dehydrogenase E2 component (dihydrolipoamide acetyltransferase)
VSKEDVEAYAARSAATRSSSGSSQAAASDNPPTRIRMSAIRSTIARRLLESKQTIPHYRLAVDTDAANLLSRREDVSSETGARITVNDMLIRACALALRQHPIVNAQLEGEEILQYAHADIAVAVATDNGLITPIVRSADSKTLPQIARCTADLADRARRGALTREEISGGTFTISNLGMYGLAHFDAIINPPQVAILAVGAAQERFVARDGAPVVRRCMTLTLSADHRVVDGAVGAQFLATLKELIERPDQL